MPGRTTRLLTVSLPPEALAEFEAIAVAEGRDRSELFREMLRTYRAQRELDEFAVLQRYGAERARAAGVLDEDDVIRLVIEERATFDRGDRTA
jgi:hypothetical protein